MHAAQSRKSGGCDDEPHGSHGQGLKAIDGAIYIECPEEPVVIDVRSRTLIVIRHRSATSTTQRQRAWQSRVGTPESVVSSGSKMVTRLAKTRRTEPESTD